jgi:hypothetical protein
VKVTKIALQEARFSTINKLTSKTMVSMAAIHQHPLYYCRKRLFSFEPFAQTEWLHQEVDRGVHHFFSLSYSEDEFIEYIESITHESTGTVVPIVNLDENEFWHTIFDSVLGQ